MKSFDERLGERLESMPSEDYTLLKSGFQAGAYWAQETIEEHYQKKCEAYFVLGAILGIFGVSLAVIFSLR